MFSRRSMLRIPLAAIVLLAASTLATAHAAPVDEPRGPSHATELTPIDVSGIERVVEFKPEVQAVVDNPSTRHLIAMERVGSMDVNSRFLGMRPAGAARESTSDADSESSPLSLVASDETRTRYRGSTAAPAKSGVSVNAPAARTALPAFPPTRAA